MATVTGTPGDDLDTNKIKGTNDWDRLFGLSGNDELAAYDGVDWLEGGPGGDSLDGGLGSDVASYASSAQGIKINLAAGTFTGGDIVGDTFFSIEAFEGSARKDEMRGDDGSNNFMGLGGNDRFWGGADVDSITGEAGKDMIEGGADGDLMVGSTGAGRYIYKAVSDSTPGAGGDYIELDQGDRIDLSRRSTPRPARAATRPSRSSVRVPSPARARSGSAKVPDRPALRSTRAAAAGPRW